MNKKLIYLSAFLIIAAFLISSCSQARGARINSASEPIIGPNDEEFQLTVTKSGGAGGKVIGIGIKCINGTGDCSESYTAVTKVTLTAVLESPYDVQFLGWSGACTGTNPRCTLKINSNKEVNAKFTGKARYQSSGVGLITVNNCLNFNDNDDPFTSGYATFVNLTTNSQETSYDTCHGYNNINIHESSCKNSGLLNITTWQCTGGCSNGACN